MQGRSGMKFFHFRRNAWAAALPVAALVAVSAAALAQTASHKVPAATGQRTAFAGPLATNRTFNRLIVKLKNGATTLAGVFDFNGARDTVSLLGASAGLNTGDAQAIRLDYFKSLTPYSHVALTSKHLSRAELFALAKRLEQDPRVAYAEIDEMAQPLLDPADPDYVTQQWHYKRAATEVGGASLPAAWDSATGTGVVVAVLDTGYRPHADLAANVLPGYDFIEDIATANDGDGRDGDAQDPGDWSTTATSTCTIKSSWHGTHVAGIVAALHNNGMGGVGVAFDAKVLPVRVLGVCGGYTSDIAAGMRWAAGLTVPGVPTNTTHVAKILNMSLGSSGTCSQTYQDAVNEVRAAGSVVVAATGNDHAASIDQPANCAGVIAVTAHTRLGDKADYANIGAGTALSAPGGGYGTFVSGNGETVYSTYNTGTTTPAADNYVGLKGTSLAAPHVAGVAALLAQLQPTITPDTVQSVLVNSTRPHPAGTFCANRADCGTGLLDAAQALARLTSLPVTTATVSPSGIRPTGSTITLTGSASAVSGGSASFSYQWTQLAGPTVSLSDATSTSASFVAPATGASFVFNFRATDATGMFGESRVAVSTDTAPVLNSIAPQSVVQGGNLSFTATATDAENDTVVFVANGFPAGSAFDAATGVFTWNNASPVGTYSFTITPNDGIFSGTPQTVTITVVASRGGGGAMDWPELLALLALASAGSLSGRRKQNAHR
jgi:serine protease